MNARGEGAGCECAEPGFDAGEDWRDHEPGCPKGDRLKKTWEEERALDG